MRIHRIAACLAALLAAACQPLPQPFQHVERLDPKLTTLKDTFGVRIDPIDGLPQPMADALAAAMVQAFEDEDVPATVNGGNQRSFRLHATSKLEPAAGGVSNLTLVWDVADQAGAKLGRSEQQMPLVGGVLTPNIASVLAHRAVNELSPHVTDAAPAAQRTDAVIVWSIDGAPGDGKTALKRAVEYVLRENKVPVADTKQENASLLLATVEAAKPKDGKQDFSIRWVLMRPDGTEVGAVEQHNAIPAGSLDGTWGDTALLIAEAAYDGIAALIDAERTRE